MTEFKEDEIKSKIRDAWMEIKDLEAELEFMELREPDEWKYIASLKNRIDILYNKVEELNEIN
tara:strand:- start:147 stop:335 length:189 start_codon:yes stop_codon:yes gene_type:complete